MAPGGDQVAVSEPTPEEGDDCPVAVQPDPRNNVAWDHEELGQVKKDGEEVDVENKDPLV